MSTKTTQKRKKKNNKEKVTVTKQKDIKEPCVIKKKKKKCRRCRNRKFLLISACKLCQQTFCLSHIQPEIHFCQKLEIVRIEERITLSKKIRADSLDDTHNFQKIEDS